jgi:Protein of unknown function (DUF4058)
MPLLDHFQPPLSERRRWESFHATWLGVLADTLNEALPEGYFAEQEVHAGPSIEIDVATYDESSPPPKGPAGTGDGVATLPARTWAPPAAALTLPAVFADDFEVRVISTRTGPRLVAAIELVSPRNKDRLEARRAFATKCASYLHQGVALVIIDVVTERSANLHNEIMTVFQNGTVGRLPAEVALYSVAYQPLRRQGREEIDLWPAALQVGGTLPVMPLALNAALSLPVDLEATYTEARRRRRLL